MRLLIRSMALVFAFLMAAGPLSAVAAPVSQVPAPASSSEPAATPAASAGTFTGTVKDPSGAPVPDAVVTATGPTSASTKTGSKGEFELTLSPGIYTINVAKPGLQHRLGFDYVIAADVTQNVGFTLSRITFESIKEIGHVSVSGNNAFNTGPASVATISGQSFSEPRTVAAAACPRPDAGHRHRSPRYHAGESTTLKLAGPVRSVARTVLPIRLASPSTTGRLSSGPTTMVRLPVSGDGGGFFVHLALKLKSRPAERAFRGRAS